MPRSSFLNSTLSLGLLLLIWQLAAALVASVVLPSPFEVLNNLSTSIQSGELPRHLGVTLYRLAISFFLAMFLGVAIGLILGRQQKTNAFFDSWLIILL
ncbi:MAG TPA: ABC transporter permease, partial [Cycloclasticus sp.]|nr:ABC transporter permease [Cycloclasticus sp.]